jgi:O-antigen/teichoic acid export membrane protein
MAPAMWSRPITSHQPSSRTERTPVASHSKYQIVKMFRQLLSFLRGSSGASAIANVAVTNGLILGLNVLTGILTARALGPEGRGELAAITLWPQFLGYALAFALPSAVVYQARRDPAGKSGIAGRAILLSAIGGGIAAAIGLSLTPLLLQHAEGSVLLRARWMMVFAPFATISTMLTALIQLEERFEFYNRMRYLPLLLTSTSLLVLAVLHRMSPLTAALACFLPGIPVFLWMAWWVRNNIRPSLRRDEGQFRPLLSYGARAYGGEAAGSLLGQLDKLVLVNMLTIANYGVYVVIFNLSRIITMLAASIAPVLFPKSAGKSPEEVIHITDRALSVALPLLLLGAAGLVAVGGIVLRSLYGAEFSGGYVALCVLSIEAVFFSVAYVITQPFLALNRPGVITVIQVLSLPLLALAMWLLVPPFGITGAAAALLIATLMRTVCTLLAYRIFPNIRAPRIVPSLSGSLALLRRLKEAT